MFKQKIDKIKQVTEVISLDDLKKITEDKNSAHKISRVAWVSRLKRWLYAVDNNISSLKVANSLVEPSYVSLETVLSHHSIIPDAVTSYTSVSTLPTKTLENSKWVFYYSSLKENLYFWYKYQDGVFIAEVEKAILDYFYLRSKDLRLTIYDYNNINKEKYSSQWCKKALKWFEAERFENLDVVDFQKLSGYSKKFNKKVSNMAQLLEYYYLQNEQKFRKIL